MTIPIPSGRITASFLEPRPLSNPGAHIHGALDIAPRLPGVSVMTFAPVSGVARFYQLLRPSLDYSFPKTDKYEISACPVRSYFYDTYGGIITILEPASRRLHILTHYFASALWSTRDAHYVESNANTRFPGILLASDSFAVREGEALVPVGNAGFSTGHHIHWEIHPDAAHAPYAHAERLDPEALLTLESTENL